MTLTEIRDQITGFTEFDLDNYLGRNPTPDEMTGLVNWAIRAFSKKTRCNYSTQITMTLEANDSELDCRDLTNVTKKVLEPRRVTINGSCLRNRYGDYGLWSLSDIEECYPSYQTYDAAQPVRAAWLPNNKLLLSPKVDQAYSNSFISGWYLAADLVTGTDDSNSPDIPEEYHEVLSYLAAYYAATPNSSEQEGWARLGEFKSNWMEAVDELERKSRNLIMGGTKRGSKADWAEDLMVI